MGGLRRLGASILAASVPGAGMALGRAAWHGIEDLTRGPWAPDQAVAAGISLIGCAVATYLAITALPLLIPRRYRRLRCGTGKHMPRLWRSVVVLALGCGVTTLGAGAASADGSPAWGNPDPSPSATGVEEDAPRVVEPSPADAMAPLAWNGDASAVSADNATLDDGIAAADPAASPPPSAPPATAGTDGSTYVVVPGDSLWRIAARLLPRDASDSAITQAWQAIYAANRDVVGEDPGLIFAGQRLAIPAEVSA